MLFRPFSSRTGDLVTLVRKFLESSDIYISEIKLGKMLREHPAYPSLLCIKDVMEEIGYETIVARFQEESLDSLPKPFFAAMGFNPNTRVAAKDQPRNHVEEYWIIDELKNDTVFYRTHRHKQQLTGRSNFLLNWSGIALFGRVNRFKYRQPSPLIRIQNAFYSYRLTFSLAIWLVGFLVFGYSTISNNDIYALNLVVLFILKTLGLFVCVMLVHYEITGNSTTIASVCSVTKQVNCRAVLNSRLANIIPGVSLGELGLYYFAGGLLLIITADSYHSFLTLSTISLFAVPMIIYSLFYQWRMLRQWCLLCLLVHSIIILEIFNTLVSGIRLLNTNNLQQVDLRIVIFAFTLPVLAWIAIREYIRLYRLAVQRRADLTTFKFNKLLKSALLSSEEQAFPQYWGISLGSDEPSSRIVIVCNPYCPHCASAHIALEKLLENNHDIKLRILFAVSDKPIDKGRQAAKHLLSISKRGDNVLTSATLNYWYTMKPKLFANLVAKFPLGSDDQDCSNEINEMVQWCVKVGITHTPTYFVNGRKLPPQYKASDLRHFIDN